jgi:hypothetical protein
MTRHQWDKRIAGAVVVLATLALSFSSLRALAEMCGFTGWLGWVWPICLDAVAYLATRVWLEKGAAYRFGRFLAIGAISLSLAANGLVHGLTEYDRQPHWVIVVLVGAVPPLMLALVAHLLVVDRSDTGPAPTAVPEPSAGTGQTGTAAEPDRSTSTTGRPADQTEPIQTSVPDRPDQTGPVPTAVPVHRDRKPRTRTGRTATVKPTGARTGSDQGEPSDRSDAVLLDRLRELTVSSGHVPSLTAVRTGLRVGTGRARRLLTELDRPDVPDRSTALHLVVPEPTVTEGGTDATAAKG